MLKFLKEKQISMHFKKIFNKKYKINKISEVDKVELSEYYKKTFYQRYKSLTNNWRWWYRVGYDKQEPIILSIDNKIIDSDNDTSLYIE